MTTYNQEEPTNPLDKVPRLLTEQERHSIQQCLQHAFDTKLVNYNCVDTLAQRIKELTELPPKQPWELSDFLGQLAEWGTMEGVEYEVCGHWVNLNILEKDRISNDKEYYYFSDITAIRLNNGEPVRCEK